MNLSVYDPFLAFEPQEWGGLRQMLQRVEKEAQPLWRPRADIQETENEYVLLMDLPGMTKDQVQLSFGKDNTLRVFGERREDVQFGKPMAEGEEVQKERKEGEEERKEEKKEERKKGKRVEKHFEPRYMRCERHWGKFSREYTLPQGVDSKKIQAIMQQGVLQVHIPKPSKKKEVTQHIEIEMRE